MRKGWISWPKLAFIYMPLLLVAVDSVVLISEYLQPDGEKAIRLVKESKSRKEIFTVQQYLYTTVYFRKNQGEQVTIEGWKVGERITAGAALTVEFSYFDGDGRHVASWEVDVERKKITPTNEEASHLSWH
jgi:hypothetical protein